MELKQPKDSLELLSVVVPVFNDVNSLQEFTERMIKNFRVLDGRVRCELIFVDNASYDGSFQKIEELSAEHDNVFFIRQSRNFGYQSSILLGLTEACGDLIAFIDVDCEDPPEMIPDFVEGYFDGYDLVYGERSYGKEFIIIKQLRRLFYRITRRIADWEFILDMAEFCLISSRVRDEALKSKSTFPFVRSAIAYVGFLKKPIPYTREKRNAGVTHYNLLGMFYFAISGILSASTFPLRLISYIFLALLFVAPLFFVFGIDVLREVGYEVFLISLIYLNLFCLSVVGIYISRIYKDVAGRPIFVIDKKNTNYPSITTNPTEG